MIPKTLTSQAILVLTYYDRMSNQDRGIVFRAYEYNHSKKIYELKRPELLTEDIIKKLQGAD